MNRVCTDLPARLLRILAPVGFALAITWARPLHASDALPGRLWLELGLGVGQLSEGSNPFSDGGTGFKVDALAGIRLSPRWSLGIDIGGVGVHPSNRNYDPHNAYSSVWGEGVSLVQVVAQYEPAVDHGWLFAAGTGPAYYHNQVIESAVGRTSGRLGAGHGVGLRVGYDWLRGRRSHVLATLGLDAGRIDFGAPLTGNFRFSTVSATVAAAFR